MGTNNKGWGRSQSSPSGGTGTALPIPAGTSPSPEETSRAEPLTPHQGNNILKLSAGLLWAVQPQIEFGFREILSIGAEAKHPELHNTILLTQNSPSLTSQSPG